MKKYLCLLVFLFVLVGCTMPEWSKEQPPQVGEPVNLDLIFKDEADRDVSLSDFKGKKIYLNIWGTWCSPCREEIPELEQVYQDYKDKDDYVFLSMAVPSDRAYGNKHTRDKQANLIIKDARQLGATYPIVFDQNNQAVSRFVVLAYPTHIFINSDGTLNRDYKGNVTKESLEQMLEEIQ